VPAVVVQTRSMVLLYVLEGRQRISFNGKCNVLVVESRHQGIPDLNMLVKLHSLSV
jgi:hypothetical protein